MISILYAIPMPYKHIKHKCTLYVCTVHLLYVWGATAWHEVPVCALMYYNCIYNAYCMDLSMYVYHLRRKQIHPLCVQSSGSYVVCSL